MIGYSIDIFSHQQLVESLPVPAYACDSAGYVQICNGMAVELLGKAPVPGKEKWTKCWSAYLPDGTPLDLDALGYKELSGMDMLILRQDGSRRYIRLYLRNVPGPDGQPVGSMHVVTDITEERLKEEKVALLAAIVQSSEDAIISKTLTGIITSWNEGATRIFGFSAEEMIGQPVTRLIPPDRLQEEPAILERLKRGERVEHFETKRINKYNGLIDISLTISPVMDSTGAIIGASKVARDISMQIEAERKVREREQLFRMTVESTNIGSWEFYPEGMRLIWSDESRRMWGVPENTQLTPAFLESMAFEDDWQLLRESAFEATKGDGHFEVKFRIKRADTQEIRWMKVQGKALFAENGLPERFIGTMLDITADKTFTDRLEAIVSERTSELVELNHHLKRSNHDLEQFAYIASHDLQEPLRKIQTFAEFIERSVPDPVMMDHYAKRIKMSTHRMSNLIRDVLNYSRLSRVAGRLDDVCMNTVLKDVISGLNREIVLSGAIVQIAGLPVIKGNRDQLYQLFHNLISNSLKFCNRSPVIHILSSLQEQQVEIILKDNGIGFEQQYAEKIFHIFSHLNSIEQYSGTGIGLALCRKIVENHGGVITASGVPGEGAFFYITLPC